MANTQRATAPLHRPTARTSLRASGTRAPAATGPKPGSKPPPPRGTAKPGSNKAPSTKELADRYEQASSVGVAQFAARASARLATLETVTVNGKTKHKGVRGSDLDHRVAELNRTATGAGKGGGAKNRQADLVDLAASMSELTDNLDPKNKKYIKDPQKRAIVKQVIADFERTFGAGLASGPALDKALGSLLQYRDTRKHTGWQGGLGNAVANTLRASDGSNATVRDLHQNSDTVRALAYLDAKPNRTVQDEIDRQRLAAAVGQVTGQGQRKVDAFDAQVEKNAQVVNGVVVSAVVIAASTTGAGPLALGGLAALSSGAANTTDRLTGSRQSAGSILKTATVNGLATAATAKVFPGAEAAPAHLLRQGSARALARSAGSFVAADRFAAATIGASDAALSGHNPLTGAVAGATARPSSVDIGLAIATHHGEKKIAHMGERRAAAREGTAPRASAATSPEALASSQPTQGQSPRTPHSGASTVSAAFAKLRSDVAARANQILESPGAKLLSPRERSDLMAYLAQDSAHGPGVNGVYQTELRLAKAGGADAEAAVLRSVAQFRPFEPPHTVVGSHQAPIKRQTVQVGPEVQVKGGAKSPGSTRFTVTTASGHSFEVIRGNVPPPKNHRYATREQVVQALQAQPPGSLDRVQKIYLTASAPSLGRPLARERFDGTARKSGVVAKWAHRALRGRKVPAPQIRDPQRAAAQKEHLALARINQGVIQLRPHSPHIPDEQFVVTVTHELSHINEPRLTASEWVLYHRAMNADRHPVSSYGTTNVQEDLAEATALYWQVRGTPRAAEIRGLYPSRFAVLDQIHARTARQPAP